MTQKLINIDKWEKMVESRNWVWWDIKKQIYWSSNIKYDIPQEGFQIL